MGKVHQKMGNLRLAQEEWDAAINIRRALQAKGDGKQMFSKEMKAAEETKAKVEPELEVKSRPESDFQFESEVKETLQELCDRCAQHMDHIIVASTVCLVARCTTLQ